MGLQTGQNFQTSKHLAKVPAIGIATIHIFVKPQYMPTRAKVLRHGHDLVIIKPLAHHHIDLDRLQANSGSLLYALKHPFNGYFAVTHMLKALAIKRIKANRSAL